ncbi:MAG TPA: glycosyltransferase family 2 protein [Candidatus Sulfopaludibacter sp.]|jgi:GT2 family glycosyltransferase|nr:glycosyltransferase family 2 protein [Candidatus Sulfopaludibacter sp.]
MTIRLSAVVPVWNGRALLERLLATLAVQTCPVDELIVVDNGSEDGAPELARQAGARVIEMGRNAGFAVAVNRGIRESRGEWIAVLNSDVELAPDYFEQLLKTRAWFATGRILSAASPDTIDATFDATCRGGTTWRVGSGCPDGTVFRTARQIWSAPWTAVVFRAAIFERVGLLEESFESYLEDVDFGLRCAQAGCSGEYLPDAVARHHGSAARGRWHPETVRLIARNQVLLLARHFPEKLITGWMGRIVVAQILWGFVAWKHGAGSAWLRGKRQGLCAYRAARTAEPCDIELLELTLTTYESVIREIQNATRWTSYWKLYFLLTRGGAK